MERKRYGAEFKREAVKLASQRFTVSRKILLLLCLCCTACAERPMFGIELGSQRVQDCVPGSVSKPCN